MNLAEKLVLILKNSSELTTVLGSNARIYPIFATQTTTPPILCYEIKEGEPVSSTTCTVRHFDVHLHAFSTSYLQAYKITEILFDLLHRYTDDYISFLESVSAEDIPEMGEEGKFQIFHRERIFHVQTTN